MSTLGWVLIGTVIFLVFVFVLLKKKKKKKKWCVSGQKHPSGHIKYHKDTETLLRSALEKPETKKKDQTKKQIAVFEFKGDRKASDRKQISQVIDEILLNKDDFNEVVFLVESPGGSVAEYGHIYAEVARIPASGLELTACVDTVAASGGYLICLPANKILASPFAIIGSIGVVSFIPNFRKLLEKFNIEPRTFTAGEYKRTVDFTDRAGPEDVKHFKNQLELIHDQFKQALKRHRTKVNLEEVATGEAWLAKTSIDKNYGLIDELKVSSEYLLEKNRTQDIVEFKFKESKKGIKSIYKKLFELIS